MVLHNSYYISRDSLSGSYFDVQNFPGLFGVRANDEAFFRGRVELLGMSRFPRVLAHLNRTVRID